MRKYFFIIFLFIAINSSAQFSDEIDSLINLTSTQTDDSSKVENLIKLSWELVYYDYNEAIKYGNDAFKLSSNISYPQGKADALKTLGSINYMHSKYDSAETYYLESSNIYEQLKDSVNLAKVVRNLGSIYHQQGNYELAIEYFFESLNIRKDLNDDKGIASLYNSIGLVYVQQGEKMFDNALKYFNNALKIYIKLDDYVGIARTYNRIGSVYVSYKEQNFKYAIYYFYEALYLSDKFSDYRLKAQVADAIGVIYLQMGKYSSSLKFLKQGLDLWLQMNNDFNIAQSYSNLGNYYLNTNVLDTAEYFFNKTVLIAEQIEAPALKMNAYNGLYQTYKYTNNPAKALYFHEGYISLKDSLETEEVTNQITRYEMQIEFDQIMKENELEQQRIDLENKNRLKRQKLVSYFTLFAFAFMLLIAIAIYRNFRNKKKANLLLQEKNEEITIQNSLLNKQKEEITAQRDEIEAHKDVLLERNIKIEQQQKNITDSIKYAQRIQTAILPPDNFFIENLADYFIFFKPRDIVSGDFYWAAKKQNLTFIAAVDCTGHGVPGAFMSMLGVSFLNEIISKNKVEDLTAAEILEQLRQYIKHALKQTGKDNEAKDGMDMALSVIDKNSSKIQFAGAQNPLIIVRNNEIIQIKGDRMPIGIHIYEKSFTNHILDINKNDMLYMFSDGFPDQFGGIETKKYMIRNFKDLLLNIANLTLKEQKNRLELEFSNWIKPSDQINHEQLDDILVIGIRI